MTDRTVHMEDGFIIEGDEAWLPEEWEAEQARRTRVAAVNRAYNARRPERGRRRPKPPLMFVSPSLATE